jgi:DNA mismatch repair protein MutS
MEKLFPRIRNWNVSVRESNGRIVFLRKLARGGSEHSFGIHVARLAGMPSTIVSRSETILQQLETAGTRGNVKAPDTDPPHTSGHMQLSMFQLDDPVLMQIRDEILHLDINNLTPMEALNKLDNIRKILKGR